MGRTIHILGDGAPGQPSGPLPLRSSGPPAQIPHLSDLQG